MENNSLSSDDLLKKIARKKAEEKSDFYIHLGVYLAVNLFLIVMWYFTLGPTGFPWFIFPLFGWGIGIVAHGVSVFFGEGYVDEMAKREYKRLKAQEE